MHASQMGAGGMQGGLGGGAMGGADGVHGGMMGGAGAQGIHGGIHGHMMSGAGMQGMHGSMQRGGMTAGGGGMQGGGTMDPGAHAMMMQQQQQQQQQGAGAGAGGGSLAGSADANAGAGQAQGGAGQAAADRGSQAWQTFMANRGDGGGGARKLLDGVQQQRHQHGGSEDTDSDADSRSRAQDRKEQEKAQRKRRQKEHEHGDRMAHAAHMQHLEHLAHVGHAAVERAHREHPEAEEGTVDPDYVHGWADFVLKLAGAAALAAMLAIDVLMLRRAAQFPPPPSALVRLLALCHVSLATSAALLLITYHNPDHPHWFSELVTVVWGVTFAALVMGTVLMVGIWQHGWAGKFREDALDPANASEQPAWLALISWAVRCPLLIWLPAASAARLWEQRAVIVVRSAALSANISLVLCCMLQEHVLLQVHVLA